MTSSDRWSGGVLLAVAGAVAYGASEMPLGDLTNPGPGFVPFWGAIVLAALSSALIVAPPAATAVGALGRADWLAIRLLGALCLFAAALDLVGYVIASAALVAVILYELRQPARIAIAVTIATPSVTYLLFAKTLGVPLPKGLLPF